MPYLELLIYVRDGQRQMLIEKMDLAQTEKKYIPPSLSISKLFGIFLSADFLYQALQRWLFSALFEKLTFFNI